MQTNNVLLDTHILIWLMNGDNSLSKKSQVLIEEARKSGTLFLSAISVWEVGMLEQKQRIILNKSCLEWIKESLHYGIRLLALTPEIAIESCKLPGYSAGDPADRMIIATARIQSLLLLTCDERILSYGKQNFVATMNAGNSV
jgi:PIN domain nuclease of toxin-antitoxin system